jgi:hypothetical protein
MSNQKFENIESLLKILSDYVNNIDEFKTKLEILSQTKHNIIKNDKFCDFGLIISNFDMKKDLLTHLIASKSKLFELFINRLYLDLCYIQSLLINVENTLFELTIFTEKKIDRNMFKKKHFKIDEFKEIVNDIIGNYNLVSGYLDKFNSKIKSLTEIITHEFHARKFANTLYTQYDKLALEKEKIYSLINQTINFYYDLTLQYLKIDDNINYEIFLNEPVSMPLPQVEFYKKEPILEKSKPDNSYIGDVDNLDNTDNTDNLSIDYKNNHDINFEIKKIPQNTNVFIKKDDTANSPKKNEFIKFI